MAKSEIERRIEKEEALFKEITRLRRHNKELREQVRILKQEKENQCK